MTSRARLPTSCTAIPCATSSGRTRSALPIEYTNPSVPATQSAPPESAEHQGRSDLQPQMPFFGFMRPRQLRFSPSPSYALRSIVRNYFSAMAFGPSQKDRHHLRRRRPGRIGAPGRRAVDDQHRHGGRRRYGRAGRGARGGRIAARPHHGQQRGSRSRGSGDRPNASATSVSTCRSSATFTTTATCCSRSIPRLRARACQISHQSRQRGRQAARRELPHHRCASPSTTTKPVRIGVNWGSLDQDLLTQMMDENARCAEPARREGRLHRGDARERAALRRDSPRRRGSRHDRIMISAKVSQRARPRGRVSRGSPRVATIRCTWASPRPEWE